LRHLIHPTNPRVPGAWDWRRFVFDAWYGPPTARAGEVKMPSLKFARTAAIAALLLGAAFLAANLYLDATGHPKLANMFFILAILCDVAFVVFIVLWAAVKSWLIEPARPPAPTPGVAADKKPRPPQPRGP
jgi:hypothetical protein